MALALDPAVDIAARAALALLFAAAAREKLRDPLRFRAALADYRVLPARFERAAAPLVPSAEAAAALALAARPVSALVGGAGGAAQFAPAMAPAPAFLGAAGPLLAAALLVLYTGAIAWNLARGRRDVDCGCLGPRLRVPLSGWLVARNALLLAPALLCLLPQSARPLVWLDAATAASAAALLALAWHAAHLALANAARLERLQAHP